MVACSSHHLCRGRARGQRCPLQLGQLGPSPSSRGVVLGPVAAAAEEQECFACLCFGRQPGFGERETALPASGSHLWPFGEHEGCWAFNSLLTPSSARMSHPAREGRAVGSRSYPIPIPWVLRSHQAHLGAGTSLSPPSAIQGERFGRYW